MAYGEVDTSDADSVGLFALPALFITFRETLEAAIIVSVLLGLLEKLELRAMKRYVWIGVLSGVFLCVLVGVVFLVVINLLKENLLEGDTEKKVQGAISVIAAVLIAVVALTIGNVMGIHDKYHERLSSAMDEQAISKRSIFFLSFTAVVREGLETIIFFTGVGAAYPSRSLPIPAIVGAIIGVIVGVALYRFGGRLTIRIFFKATMTLLVFIGAGVFTNGMHEIQETGAFGSIDPATASGLNKVMFDINDCCGLDVSEFWVMMRVLFGYQPEPTGFEWLMYIGYHVITWLALVYRYYNSRRKDNDELPLWRALLTCSLQLENDPEGRAEKTAKLSSHDSSSSGRDSIQDLESPIEPIKEGLQQDKSTQGSTGGPDRVLEASLGLQPTAMNPAEEAVSESNEEDDELKSAGPDADEVESDGETASKASESGASLRDRARSLSSTGSTMSRASRPSVPRDK